MEPRLMLSGRQRGLGKRNLRAMSAMLAMLAMYLSVRSVGRLLIAHTTTWNTRGVIRGIASRGFSWYVSGVID